MFAVAAELTTAWHHPSRARGEYPRPASPRLQAAKQLQPGKAEGEKYLRIQLLCPGFGWAKI